MRKLKDVLRSVNNLECSIGSNLTNITSQKPAVRWITVECFLSFFRVTEVARHYGRSPDKNLALRWLVSMEIVHLWDVSKSKLDILQRPSNMPTLRVIWEPNE